VKAAALPLAPSRAFVGERRFSLLWSLDEPWRQQVYD
jgi:hypothetical protein